MASKGGSLLFLRFAAVFCTVQHRHADLSILVYLYSFPSVVRSFIPFPLSFDISSERPPFSLGPVLAGRLRFLYLTHLACRSALAPWLSRHSWSAGFFFLGFGIRMSALHRIVPVVVVRREPRAVTVGGVVRLGWAMGYRLGGGRADA